MVKWNYFLDLIKLLPVLLLRKHIFFTLLPPTLSTPKIYVGAYNLLRVIEYIYTSTYYLQVSNKKHIFICCILFKRLHDAIYYDYYFHYSHYIRVTIIE